jgi:2-polyprenyl-6-methoxyphenol hydroxylase-like FAD-dependent oxidoreductase
MVDQPRIVIVGAGLGGLSLARILHVNGISCVVLELEDDRDARTQGGMLDIHDDSGRIAIRAAGLEEQFQELILSGAEARRALDKHGAVWFSSEGPGGRPEVERGELRSLLLDSLPDGMVRWGAKVMGARAGNDATWEVRLADGTTVPADLLIGADGTWSRVRALTTDVTPIYSGVTSVDGYLYDADRNHPEAARAIGKGSMFAVGHHQSLMAHREADARLHFYAWMHVDEDWSAATDFTELVGAKEAVLQQYTGWDDSLRGVIAGVESQFFVRPLYLLPADHRWPHVPGLTLLGDAAHVMSPTGDGANLAMLDAADLAAALVTGADAAEAAVTSFEETMFNRAKAIAHESAGMVGLLMDDPNAPREFVTVLAQLEGLDAPPSPYEMSTETLTPIEQTQ